MLDLTRRSFIGGSGAALASSAAWSEADVEEYAELVSRACMSDFWVYRQVVNPGMRVGWWQREIAGYLEDFYQRWQQNQRPVMVIQAPPQHGKSKQVEDFISWCSGINPDVKFMYTSYSNDLGVRCNMGLQRTYDSPMYRNIFPSTRISESNVVTVAGRYLRNSHFIEYVDRKGSFRNTTVGGPITGMTLDFGVIDDPIKGRAEAQSEVTREGVWSWLTDDFFSRFSEHAAMLMIMTRWHHDDPVGRFIERHPSATVLRYPAIAEVDERHRKTGEALFPEHKSLAFLEERRALMTSGSWESLYQQNPSVQGGGMFPTDRFAIVQASPARKDIKRSVRYWDKAGSVDSGAYTVGVLMHELHNKEFFISDVVRGQWGALQREERIRQCAEIDNSNGMRIETWVEQEPGSGGKESAEGTIRNLRGYKVYADRVTGKKEIRAEPYAAQVQGRNVQLYASKWNRVFLQEHEDFPQGKYKDQVDAAGGAFAKLTTRSSYDSTMSWVG